MAASKITTAAIPEPRLIPHAVSYHAKNDPSKIWGSVPRSESDTSQGYEDITFARLNYAISRACQWLLDVVEPDRRCKFEPLAYIGPPDSRYIILTIAAIKTGYQVGSKSTSIVQPNILLINEMACRHCSYHLETATKHSNQSFEKHHAKSSSAPSRRK